MKGMIFIYFYMIKRSHVRKNSITTNNISLLLRHSTLKQINICFTVSNDHYLHHQIKHNFIYVFIVLLNEIIKKPVGKKGITDF